jgi:hypothetical protein
MQFDQRLVDTYLTRAVEEFDTNPLATQLMRRLATEGPELFFEAAMKHLSSPAHSNAHRLLCILMLRQSTLLEYIATPGVTTRERAVHLFNRFLAVDPSFDVKLARMLPGRTYANYAEAFDALHSARALDILDQTSRGRRLLPILGHLPNSENANISAKATLFVGKRVQNPAWTAKQLARSDQRVRANAVEALWGLDTRPAISLLETCVGDKNNRVVGNAVVGLHIAGRTEAQSEALSMSRSPTPDKRLTSAWVMGKIAGSVFSERLTQLVRDEVPQVRGMALRSLLEIRRADSKTPESIAEKIAEQTPEATRQAIEEVRAFISGSVSDRFLYAKGGDSGALTGPGPGLRLNASTYAAGLSR